LTLEYGTRVPTLERRAPIVSVAGAGVEPGAVPAVEVPGVVVGQEETVPLPEQVRYPGVEPCGPDLGPMF
jgi:hypothetical protein